MPSIPTNNVEYLLNQINNDDIRVPEFQRSFVWDPQDTRDLIISIAKEYFAGSLLFWRPPLKAIADRPIEGVKGTSKQPKRLVLDGQQRLTSLYQAFYGTGKHRFFLDISRLRKNQLDEETVIFFNVREYTKKQLDELSVQAKENILHLPNIFSLSWKTEFAKKLLAMKKLM